MQENHPAASVAPSAAPTVTQRFGIFSREEMEAIQGGLASTVATIMRVAADPTHEICRNPDAAQVAADMLNTAGTLVMEISDHLGEEHPPAEVLAEIVERVRYMAILDLLPEGGG